MVIFVPNNLASWRMSHGWHAASRRVVERDRAFVSSVSPFAGWRPTAEGRTHRAEGNSVCVEDRHRLGGLAAGCLRLLLQDLQASPRRVVADRALAADTPSVSGQTSRSRPLGLVASVGRLQPGESSAGRTKTGPNPTDRGRAGSKHCLLTDAGGVPLVLQFTSANEHDVSTLLPLVTELPAVPG